MEPHRLAFPPPHKCVCVHGWSKMGDFFPSRPLTATDFAEHQVVLLLEAVRVLPAEKTACCCSLKPCLS